MSEQFANSKLADMEAEADRLHAEMYAQKDEAKAPEPETEPEAVQEGEETVEVEAQPDTESEQPVEEESGNDETQEATEKAESTTEASDDAEQDALTVKNADKRIKDAQRRMTKATQEAAQLRRDNESLRDKVTSLSGEVAKLKAITQAPTATDADLARLQEEYPDLAKPLIAQLHSLKAEQESAKAQQEELRKHAQTDQAKQSEIEHREAISAVHPDAWQLAGQVDFREWLADQPSYKRAVVETGSAEDVIDLLHEYKATLAPPPPKPTLETAKEIAEPTTRSTKAKPQGKKTWTRAEIDQMSMQEFIDLQPQIDEALKNGRVI